MRRVQTTTFVYLDNNAIINIEEGKIKLPAKQSIIYPFSYVHIEELLESGNRLAALKDNRLNILSRLSQDSYLIHNDNRELSIIAKSPSAVFEDLNNPFIEALKLIVKKDCEKMVYKDEIIEHFEIDRRIINNYTPEQLLANHSDFIESYILSSCKNRQESFNSFFNAMDMLGFWQDKRTTRSTLARLYDANHAYHATFCDYFVTDDVRTRNKANVLYSYYNYTTKAISTAQLLDLLK